ncbi:MAG: restriction endonuclease subunit S [Candidatus Berkelbacteria bacterium]|nr:restriction endonuclease subunit S [Candidatus Berkelbacteria bacterium]
MILHNDTKFKETELGLIPEDWEIDMLGNRADVIMGQSPESKYYNKNQEGLYFMQGVRTFGEKYPIFDTWTTSATKTAPAESVLMSVRAPVGDLNITPVEMCLGRGLAAINAKNGNNEYIYQLLEAYRDKVLGQETGTVYGSISRDDIFNLELPFAPKDEQQKIAEVLGTLDEKIELNHKMNKTLESLAQAIFKKWFIENADPDWETKKLKDICEIKNGFAFKSGDYSKEGIFLLRTSNFNSEGYAVKNDPIFLPNNFYQTFSNYRLKRFDILLVMVGASVGKRSFVFSNILPALQNQNMWNFRAYDQKNQFFLKFMIDQIVESNIGSASGSARDFFRKDYFREIEFNLPNQNLLDKFYERLLPQFEMIDKNIKEIDTLSQIRDSLLPRLMSGKLRVT